MFVHTARCAPRCAARHIFAPRSARAQVCPLLLRVFPRLGAHHQLDAFARRGEEPKDEVQVYTWMDATLRWVLCAEAVHYCV